MKLLISTAIKRLQFYILIFISFFLFSERTFATFDKFKKYDFNSGLTDNHVVDQVIDKNNFIWIATLKGLNKFDGYNYIQFTKENLKLPNNHIQSLALNDTVLYAATFGNVTAINIYNNTTRVLKNTDRNVLISKIFFTSNKLLVVYYEDGVVYFINSSNEIIKKYTFEKQNYTSIDEFENTLCIGVSSKGIVQINLKNLSSSSIYPTEVNYGNNYLKNIKGLGIFHILPNRLALYNSQKKAFLSLGNEFKNVTGIDGLNDSILILIYEQYHVRLYNFKTKKFLQQEFNIPANAIVDNVNHNNDNILLGTNQGLIVFPMSSGAFEEIKCNTHINYIPRAIIETQEGDTYFFTYSNILLKRKNETELKIINSSYIYSYSAIEVGNDIYIGTEGDGLRKLNKKTHQLSIVIQKDGFKSGIVHITSLLKFNDTKIILGCMPGLYMYDIKTKELSPLNIYTSGIDLYKLKYGFNLFDLNYKQIQFINNEIWCATNKGIVMFDKKLKFVDVINKFNSNVISNLLSDSINYIHQESKNIFWIATDNGFQQYDRVLNKFKLTFDKNKIKSNTKTIAILPDYLGRLWIPTYYGLLLYNPKTNILTCYHQHDGLINEEYNYASYVKLKNGDLIIGGINGYQLVKPSIIQQNYNTIKLRITDILKLGKNNEYVSLNDTKKIILNLDDDFIQIRFSTNQYYHTESLSYYYRADENSNWISTNNLPIININSLPRNTSYLYIKVVNNDNLSEQYTTKIPVYIRLKIYKEWWFIPAILLVFLILIGGVLVLWLRFSNIRKMEKNRIENENILVQNLNKEKELNSLKSKFIRLISHEYRTPLTGITTSVDLMEMLLATPQNEQSIEKERRHMRNIRTQVDRMSKLIKGVQSLNRMETYIAKMNLVQSDIKAFVKYNVELLLPSNFNLNFNYCEEDLHTMFDKDIMQQILSNILSNSVKYSFKSRQEIVVSINLVDENTYTIVIQDYGVGIPSKDLPYIFNTFYRSNEIENIQGIGLGLSITKQLTEQMNGEIDIQSSSDYGTTVTLKFPL